MLKKVKNENGSMTVEATIFLPVFIIGVILLLYPIKLVMITTSAAMSLTDESHKMSVMPISGLRERVEDDIRENGWEACCKAELKSFRGPYIGIDDDMVSAEVNCRVTPGLPLNIVSEFNTGTRVLFRMWTGSPPNSDPYSFSRMGSDEDADIVYIFPHSGKRYHKKSCGFVTVSPEAKVLDDGLRKKYSPCSICGSSDLSDGESVYCFTSYGTVYHRKECSAVTKRAGPVSREDAVNDGYTPCSSCGG